MNKTIIIGGGVGPMAGVDLHRRIIRYTRTDGTDQDHLRVLHASFSDLIPDRTEALFEQNEQIPGQRMASILLACEQAIRMTGGEGVAGIPCNTFHAPRIWNEFCRVLSDHNSSIELIHMVTETVSYLGGMVGTGCKIGILATTGTKNARVYDKPLADSGFSVCYPADQERLHQAIYHRQWGIKAQWPVDQRASTIIEQALDDLHKQDATAVLLACTELPLAVTYSDYFGMKLVNPVDILAARLIEAAAPGKLIEG